MSLDYSEEASESDEEEEEKEELEETDEGEEAKQERSEIRKRDSRSQKSRRKKGKKKRHRSKKKVARTHNRNEDDTEDDDDTSDADDGESPQKSDDGQCKENILAKYPKAECVSIEEEADCKATCEKMGETKCAGSRGEVHKLTCKDEENKASGYTYIGWIAILINCTQSISPCSF